MKIAIFLMFVFGSIQLAVADTEAQQYASGIVEQHLKIKTADLEFTEWQQSIPGGYIMKFAFDVSGDGLPERFFASSFNTEKLLCAWTVYSGSKETRLDGVISMRPDGFWWNSETREVLDYVQSGAEGGLAIISKLAGDDFVSRREIATSDEVNNGLDGKEPPRFGFIRVKPEVVIALLADIVAERDPIWRQLKLDPAGANYSLPNGRLLLAEDANRISELQKFTPQSAIDALRKITTPTTGDQTEKRRNQPSDAWSPYRNLSKDREADIGQTKSPGLRKIWIVVIFVAVAAMILSFVTLKDRRK